MYVSACTYIVRITVMQYYVFWLMAINRLLFSQLSSSRQQPMHINDNGNSGVYSLSLWSKSPYILSLPFFIFLSFPLFPLFFPRGLPVDPARSLWSAAVS